MARPYSLDLRERVVLAVSSGKSCRSVSRTFGVSVSSVVKWSQRYRKTGSAAAYRMGGNRPWVLEPARLAEKPDLTLHALLSELAERDVKVCCDALWRYLKREGISFKKNRVRQRAGSA